MKPRLHGFTTANMPAYIPAYLKYDIYYIRHLSPNNPTVNRLTVVEEIVRFIIPLVVHTESHIMPMSYQHLIKHILSTHKIIKHIKMA